MFHALYLLFIAPLEFLMRLVLEWGFLLTHSWGWSIVLLSLVVNTAILPIYNWAEHKQKDERILRRKMLQHEEMIRRSFRGQERFFFLSTLRKQFGYSYSFTLLTSIGLFLQIPFFFAAYHLLSHFQPFNNQSFSIFTDLGSPDALVLFVGIPINVLPILMTLVNILSAVVYTLNLTRRDKLQIYAMALFFLVVLYAAPTALTLYWTLNNVYSLGKNLVYHYLKNKLQSNTQCDIKRAWQYYSFSWFGIVCCVFVVGGIFWIYTSAFALLHHGTALVNTFDEFGVALWVFTKQFSLIVFLTSLVLVLIFATRCRKFIQCQFLVVGASSLLFLLQTRFLSINLSVIDGQFCFDLWNKKGVICFILWVFVIFSIQQFWCLLVVYINKIYQSATIPLALLPSLGLLYSYIFALSNNTNMLDKDMLFGALVIISGIAILLFCIFYYILPFMLVCIPSKIIRQCILRNIVAIVFCFCLFFVVDYHVSNVNFFLSAVFLAYFLVYLNKEKFLTIALSIVLCLLMLNLTKNLVVEENDANFSSFSFPSEVYNIKFKKKPNIYLFWLESYHDFETMKRIYDLDNSEYRTFLEKNNFLVQDNTFSSANHTLAAFIQLFSLHNKDLNLYYSGANVPMSMRKLIGGNENNTVLRILKANNYRTTLLVKGDYYYTTKKEKYLDEIDFPSNSLSRYLYPIQVTSLHQHTFTEKIYDKAHYDTHHNVYQGSLFDRVKLAIERNKEINQPYFISFIGGAQHPPPLTSDFVTVRRFGHTVYNWTLRDKWINSNIYQEHVAHSNDESEKIIEYIIENDPSALIILLGDHGTRLYQKFPYYDEAIRSKYDVTLAKIFDDVCRVLFAYRLPYGNKDDITNGMYMNNLNVFFHVFAYLAEDSSILNHRTQSVSRIEKFEMVEGRLDQP